MMDSVHIAMWSGPRNISSAMMRSFENRPDTTVTDEPFYAHYLSTTGIDHPGRDETLKFMSADINEILSNIFSKPSSLVLAVISETLSTGVNASILHNFRKSLTACEAFPALPPMPIINNLP